MHYSTLCPLGPARVIHREGLDKAYFRPLARFIVPARLECMTIDFAADVVILAFEFLTILSVWFVLEMDRHLIDHQPVGLKVPQLSPQPASRHQQLDQAA